MQPVQHPELLHAAHNVSRSRPLDIDARVEELHVNGLLLEDTLVKLIQLNVEILQFVGDQLLDVVVLVYHAALLLEVNNILGSQISQLILDMDHLCFGFLSQHHLQLLLVHVPLPVQHLPGVLWRNLVLLQLLHLVLPLAG